MIVVKISDGFGNQLFMYACGYAAARRLGVKIQLDTTILDTSNLRKYELDKLSINFDRMLSVQKWKYRITRIIMREFYHRMFMRKYKIFKEKDAYAYDDSITNIKDNTYLFGYWQSYKYFENYRTELLEMITPSYKLSNGCDDYISRVHKCQSVALHIRRGDYVSLGICLGKEYYLSAINFIKSIISNPSFFVISDDINYAKEMLNDTEGNFEYVRYQTDNATMDDFFIMKECCHIIMANSTFSWWAAWCHDTKSIVVCPAKNNSKDFYPPTWHQIS